MCSLESFRNRFKQSGDYTIIVTGVALVKYIHTKVADVSTDSRVMSLSGLLVLQRILDTAAERSWQVTSVNLDTLTETAFIKLLADLDYKKDYQIIIDCELERLNSILNLVKHSLILMSVTHISPI